MIGTVKSAQVVCLTARLAMALGVSLTCATGEPACAHPQLTTSVRHRTAIEIDRSNVDVTIELTLGEIPAFAERLLIDANQDQTISASEVASYLEDQSDTLQQSVTLRVAGKPVELLMLYEPEMEWDRKSAAAASHLVVRLFYFGRMPGRLQTGDTIVLEDRLWSHAPSLASYHAVGKDGFSFVAEKTASTLASTPRNAQPLVMRIRCAAAPEIGSTHPRPTPEQSTIHEPGILESRSTVSTHAAVGPIESVKHRKQRRVADPSAGPAPIGWLLGLGVAAVIASTAAVLRGRPSRPRKEV